MGEGIVPLADGYTVPEGMWKLSLFVGWPKRSTWSGFVDWFHCRDPAGQFEDAAFWYVGACVGRGVLSVEIY